MSQHTETVKTIIQVLSQALDAEVEVTDESWKHAGHAGAKSGGGHFFALIRSAKFQDKKPLERQRMVYEALGKLMEKEIHAFSMKCEPLLRSS